MTRVCLVLLGLVLVGGTAACDSGAKPPPKQAGPLFAARCAQCHAEDGSGAPAYKALVPDLTDPAHQAKMSDDAIFNVIMNGSQNGRMPPWRAVLTEAQARMLVQHVRTLKR